MSFLERLFKKSKPQSILFIDISAGSVGGAYAYYKKDDIPTVLYTHRTPIEIRYDESQGRAMIRSLEILGSHLIREGAPALARYSEIGSAEHIVVSIDAPWQETKIKKERFVRATPFIFTKKMVLNALEKSASAPAGKILADESIIGTSVNGYHVHEPYDRKVHRASVTILTSYIDEKISNSITKTLRSLFHTQNILLIAGSSLRYQAIRTMFPHESSAIILDVVGSLVSINLIRNNFLVAVSEASNVSFDGNADALVNYAMHKFVELAEQYPLPRTIFLLADESKISVLQKALESANLSKLWLSDNPPNIISVLANNVASLIKQTSDLPSDTQLLIMALYWQNRQSF